MIYLERIEKLLTTRPGLCDDCIARELQISQRQNVRSVCTKSHTILRSDGVCIGCEKEKIVRSLAAAPAPARPLPRSTAKSQPRAASYFREEALRVRFNESIATTLGITPEDFYGRLGFAELLQLKAGYARIHDIITLKLTQALADWLGVGLSLPAEKVQSLRKAVDSAHPNAAGFDLDSMDPNLIGEVKGNIPVNGLHRFGAAQQKGLTNDVRQMFGQAAGHKTPETVSLSSKIHRKRRLEALKFLGLYDSPQVRLATGGWMDSFARSHPQLKLSFAGDSKTFSADTVYIVFLKVDDALTDAVADGAIV